MPAPRIRIWESDCFLTPHLLQASVLCLELSRSAGQVDRKLSDTYSMALADVLESEIVRRKDDAFDTSNIAVVDRFLINTGFGIVTFELVGMAAPPRLAESDFNRARHFLVLGGLIISQQSTVITHQLESKILTNAFGIDPS